MDMATARRILAATAVEQDLSPDALEALRTVFNRVEQVEKAATRLSNRLNFRGEELDELDELDTALDALD